MNAYLSDTTNDGYYQRFNNDGTNRSTNQEEVDQAWMESIQASRACSTRNSARKIRCEHRAGVFESREDAAVTIH